MGFEPTTPTLARLCSTPELHPHDASRLAAPRGLYASTSARTQHALKAVEQILDPGQLEGIFYPLPGRIAPPA